jgi:hypothetical protein
MEVKSLSTLLLPINALARGRVHARNCIFF